MLQYVAIIHYFIPAQDVVIVLVIITVVVDASSSGVFLVSQFLRFRLIVYLLVYSNSIT